MTSIVDKGFFNCFISIDINVLSPPVTRDDPVPRLWLWPRAGCGGEVPGPANSRLGQALAQPQLPRLAAGQALALALGGAARHARAGARNIVTVSHLTHCHRTGSVFGQVKLIIYITGLLYRCRVRMGDNAQCAV